jgi:hypothetical protein
LLGDDVFKRAWMIVVSTVPLKTTLSRSITTASVQVPLMKTVSRPDSFAYCCSTLLMLSPAAQSMATA